MDRRLPQRLEHLPHSLLNNPVDHVGNSQPALPASRLGDEHPADPARLIPPRQQVGSQPGQHDRPLICQRIDRLPVRTRSALVRRHLQHRIRQPVRNLLHRRRRCRPNLADRLRRSRPDLPQPVPGSPTGSPFRVFCCHDRHTELHRRFFDRDRLPLPAGTRPGALNGHYPAFRYYSVLGLLLGHQSSSFRSPTYQPETLAGTQQISWGETLRLCRDRVATTPSVSEGIGHRRCETTRPPRNALRRFTFVRHHDTPMASSRPALTETPQRMTKPHWDRPVNSGPRPCLVSVGFPLSGLQDRTSTSDLNIRTQHTREGTRPTGSASTTTAAACHPTGRSGNINTNNNRRQVGPLQAIAPGPVQAIPVFNLGCPTRATVRGGSKAEPRPGSQAIR